MKNLNAIFSLLFILILFSGCQTIKKKSDEVAERENEKYGQFVGSQVNQMKLELGAPTEDLIINEVGNEVLIYKTKKYGITCERKFEVNSSGIIVALFFKWLYINLPKLAFT